MVDVEVDGEGVVGGDGKDSIVGDCDLVWVGCWRCHCRAGRRVVCFVEKGTGCFFGGKYQVDMSPVVERRTLMELFGGGGNLSDSDSGSGVLCRMSGALIGYLFQQR